MHNTKEVALLTFDSLSGEVSTVSSKCNTELLPLRTKRTSYNLKHWWKERAISLNKYNIENLLSYFNCSTPEQLLLNNLGVSLTDNYWVKPYDSEYTWDKVNLYDNFTCDEIGDYQLETNPTIPSYARTFSPGASLQGVLAKKWIKDDLNNIYLLKCNRYISQPIVNEVIASQIHAMQNKFPFVNYSLTHTGHNQDQYGCKCKNFTSKNIEFLSAYEVCNSDKKPNDVSYYDFFINICVKNGLIAEDVDSFLQYQILSDYSITNIDRHFSNFGVLRDVNSLKFIGMAPIFDNGNSMFFNSSIPDSIDKISHITVNSFVSKEINLLKYVKDFNLIDISKLPDEDFIMHSLNICDELNSARKKQIIETYNKKNDIICKLQRGNTISSILHQTHTPIIK